MPTAEGLPEDLTEYLQVWCADLLRSLGPERRESFVNDMHAMWSGGPFPDRLTVQRCVEITLGVITADASMGETLEEYGGADLALQHLNDPDMERGHALQQLGQVLATPDNVAKIKTAQARGDLSAEECATVLTSALRQPILPDPIPPPPGLPPIPEDYPESWEEFQRCGHPETSGRGRTG
jgi:hypothetical protein